MARILLMEDCAVQAMMLSDWLDMDGHETAITTNTKDALEQLTGLARFDLLITDIFGPEGTRGEDGLTLMRNIRMQSAERLRTLPIISVSGVSLETAFPGKTGWLSSDQRHVHMVKPLDVGKLTSTIAEILGDSPS